MPLLLAMALTACAETADLKASAPIKGAQGAQQALRLEPFTDIPVPKGATMDLDRSLLLGGRDAWTGRVVMNTGETAAAVFALFQREMPNLGWQPITSVQSKVSVLTFERDARIATVQIESVRLGGSEISVTVSPREAPTARGA